MIADIAPSVPFGWIETAPPAEEPVAALSRLRREFEYRRCFRDAVAKARESGDVDLIILPYLDYCFHAMALAGAPFGGVPWAAITMRLAPERHFDTRWILMPLLLRDSSLRVVFSLTAIDIEQQRTRGVPKLRYLPDPGDLRGIPSRDSARRDLGIPNAALVVLVYGTIDYRKGLFQLTAALESTKAPNLTLLIVGRQSDEVRALLGAPRLAARRSKGLLLEIDAFVGDEMQGRAFAAADVVWLGYVRHFAMSGVLVLAGLARRAVIVTRAGEMGRLARKHDLGPMIDSEDIDQIVNALCAIGDPDVRARSAESCHSTFRNHDAARVGEQLFQVLTPSPNRITPFDAYISPGT